VRDDRRNKGAMGPKYTLWTGDAEWRGTGILTGSNPNFQFAVG
jgi:hypothetical protein